MTTAVTSSASIEGATTFGPAAMRRRYSFSKASAMLRSWFRSLRVRLALLLGTAILTTLAAGIAVAWIFAVADDHVDEIASAQRRLEHLSAISGRVGDYALIALQTSEQQGQPDRLSLPRKRVQEAFVQIDGEIGRSIERSSDERKATLIAARSRVLAQMRGRFDLLDRQALDAIREARAGQAGNVERLRTAMNTFAAGFGPALSQAIAEERATANAAEAAMAELRTRLAPGAVGASLVAALLALIVYRALARPLVTRIAAVAAAAGDIARGRSEIRLAVRGHDELSLAMMRFNRMASQLARREARLIRAQERLQEIVDERTAELRGANARLSDIDLARRRFFTDVSHELRTPLTVILGEVDVTLRTNGDPDALRSALATIRTRARRLHRRVEDLLRVARSESGQLELELELIDIGGLLNDARAELEPIARQRGVALVAETGNLDLLVDADADWLRQVIEGLILNALRHSPTGGAVRLLGGIDSAGSVTIAVIDEGDGVAAADLPHVFERFYRGATEREGSGFGIGLALARWVVERHGGIVELHSGAMASGRPSGVTVTIRLPAVARRLVIGAR